MRPRRDGRSASESGTLLSCLMPAIDPDFGTTGTPNGGARPNRLPKSAPVRVRSDRQGCRAGDAIRKIVHLARVRRQPEACGRDLPRWNDGDRARTAHARASRDAMTASWPGLGPIGYPDFPRPRWVPRESNRLPHRPTGGLASPEGGNGNGIRHRQNQLDFGNFPTT